MIYHARRFASIRHDDLPDNTSRITYKFQFTAKPAFLRFLLDPIMERVFRWETHKRLKALSMYLSR